MRNAQTENPDWPDGPAIAADDPRALTLLPMLRLRWFIRLRWLFLGGAVAVLGLERFVLTNVQRPAALAGTLAALAAANVVWTFGLARPAPARTGGPGARSAEPTRPAGNPGQRPGSRSIYCF